MNKKIINITIITLLLLVFTTSTYAYIINMDFWRESRLQQSDHHDDGYEYIPNETQFIEDGCGSGTVLDKEHGLCWDANGYRFETNTWVQAQNNCSGLELGGRTDWRVPTINELLTLVKDEGSNSGTHLIELGVGFSSYQNSVYWTGDISASDSSRAWRVRLNIGDVRDGDLSYGYGVVCVSRY